MTRERPSRGRHTLPRALWWIPLLSLAGLLATQSAHAANAAPLGLEIGAATAAQVKAKLGGTTSLSELGKNKFTEGVMLGGDGGGLGVDGLKQITFIFGKDDVLQAVLMTLEKDFNRTFEMLRKKYTLVSKQIPFVGDSYARFSQGASAVVLDAPHLSFEMTLRYISSAFDQAYKARAKADDNRHEREQEEKL